MECNLKPGADVIVVQQQCPDNMPALAMLYSMAGMGGRL